MRLHGTSAYEVVPFFHDLDLFASVILVIIINVSSILVFLAVCFGCLHSIETDSNPSPHGVKRCLIKLDYLLCTTKCVRRASLAILAISDCTHFLSTNIGASG